MDIFENKDIYPEMDYFLNESKSDVIFFIDGHKLPAHKLVLSMASKVFEAMFSGNFKESEDKVIEIKDTTVEAFKVMLRFIYCEVFAITDNNDHQLVTDVCKLADRYQMRRLLIAIRVYYKPKITIDNFESISGIAFTYDMKDLIEELKSFMDNNFTTLMSRDTEDLKRMNDCTHNTLFAITVKRFKTSLVPPQFSFQCHCPMLFKGLDRCRCQSNVN